MPLPLLMLMLMLMLMLLMDDVAWAHRVAIGRKRRMGVRHTAYNL